MTTNDRWLNTEEAAEYTGRHPKTIRKAAEAGELASVQSCRRGRRRYKAAWLDAWLAGEPPRAVRSA